MIESPVPASVQRGCPDALFVKFTVAAVLVADPSVAVTVNEPLRVALSVMVMVPTVPTLAAPNAGAGRRGQRGRQDGERVHAIGGALRIGEVGSQSRLGKADCATRARVVTSVRVEDVAENTGASLTAVMLIVVLSLATVAAGAGVAVVVDGQGQRRAGARRVGVVDIADRAVPLVLSRALICATVPVMVTDDVPLC